jgi:hypothetical protein
MGSSSSVQSIKLRSLTMGPPAALFVNNKHKRRLLLPWDITRSEERYMAAPHQNQSWSLIIRKSTTSKALSNHHHHHHQRMMYQDPHGRERCTIKLQSNDSNHSYFHPNNNRRSSFPPPPPPQHAFHRPNGRSSNPMMQPPNRRFTFHAITAPTNSWNNIKSPKPSCQSRSPSPTVSYLPRSSHCLRVRPANYGQ